ncbi:MAG: serine/threonine-protein kinase, partial [Pseudomonadota bacterium]
MADRIDPATEARALELFSQSMELPPAERQRWLSEQAGDDEALTDQLRRLSEAEARSTGFLEQSPQFALRPDRIGTQVGAYTIIDEHAIGGMSTVYRAQRSDGAFEQQVAIKVFDAVHLRGDMAARFAAERRILAALEHPAIARVIDGGELDDRTPYVVMEWIEGEPITPYCNRHELDLVARLLLFNRVCEALQLAHQRGVVHRDIKPGNVLVNDSGEPKLIDFGIAKLLEPDMIGSDLPETRLGLQLMTPEYASPEQIRSLNVGQPSDVYSLGVLLYELLTGTRPYQLAGLSPAEIELTVCESIAIEPSVMVASSRASPPPGLGDVHPFKRKLKGDLDRIVMTAMRHEPEQRYHSVAAFSDDIQRYLANKPVRARGASASYRAAKFIARHRAGFSATVIAFAALVSALIVVQIQATEARKQAERAESSSQFLTEMIGRADPFELSAEPTLAGAIRASIPDLDERFSGQPELEADMRFAIGNAFLNLGELLEARQQLEQALDLWRVHSAPISQARAHSSLGLIDSAEANFSIAADHFQQGLDLLDGMNSPAAKRLRATVLNNWSSMMIKTGDYEKSAELARTALSIAEQPDVDERLEDTANIWLNYATALNNLGELEGSLEAFEHTLQILRQVGAENTPDYAATLNNMAFLYFKMDRLDDSIEAMKQSLAINESTLGEDHMDLSIPLGNIS